MSTPSNPTLVLGAGVAGLNAVLRLKELGLAYRWIADSEIGGNLRHVYNRITDWPPGDWANGKACMTDLQDVAQQEGVQPERLRIEELHYDEDVWTGRNKDGEEVLRASNVIICTGSRPRSLGVDGESDYMPYLHRSTTRDAHLFRGKTAVVVGGGDAALEGTLNLVAAGAEVELVMRSPARAQDEFLRALDHPKVKVWPVGSRINRFQRIKGGCFVFITAPESETERVDAAGAFIRIGVIPSMPELLCMAELIRDEDGFLVVDDEQRTSIPRLFAAGDVTAVQPHSLATAAGAGVRAAQAVERDLRGRRNLS